MSRGLFINIEGGEGAGKTSLIKHLSKELDERNLSHIFTREPGGTPFSEEVRKVVLTSANSQGVNPISELLLFLAARVEHVEKVIQPALDQGTVVLCDRFVDSSMAYQAYGRRCDPDIIWNLCTTLVPLLPDLTFYLDLSPEVGAKRLEKRQKDKRDRLESEKMTFHERVRQGYLTMAKRCAQRFVVLNAFESEQEIAHCARKELIKHLIEQGCICTKS